jgi:hypothetical protein
VDSNIAITQFTTSALTVAGLQWLKAQPWFPLVADGKGKLNRIVAAFVAFCTSLGVHFVWNGAEHTLVISGLTFSTIAASVYHWASQMATQEVIYRATRQKTQEQVPVPVNANPGPILQPPKP